MAIQVNAEVIDRLFKRLGTVYGAGWERSLGQTPLKDVKTTWGEYLAGFDTDDVAYALDKLTDKVPNVIGFRDLCRLAPKKDVPRLEAPKVDQAKILEEIAKQAQVKEAMTRNRSDARDWAPKIIYRHEHGEKISPTVLKMAKDTVAGWQP